MPTDVTTVPTATTLSTTDKLYVNQEGHFRQALISLLPPGTPGQSAYAAAVAAGFSGTQAQWVASLQGTPGASAYAIAQAGGYVGTQAAWLTSLQGTPGLTAYQVAQAGGYGGTQAQWLATLKGADGASAYAVAQAAGYGGTQTQWLATLVGATGPSAYAAAVAGGYSGTQAQWIASLQGQSAYAAAVAGGFSGTQAQWLASLQGAAGQSAYAAAVAGGYSGTQAQWLASLKGADGVSPDLADVTVSATTAQLAAGVTSNVAANGAYTSPALDASVATPPKRFAVKAAAGGPCTLTFPDATGTSSAVPLLAGESLILRQKTTSGWGAESGNKPLAQLDARYGTTSTIALDAVQLRKVHSVASGLPPVATRTAWSDSTPMAQAVTSTDTRTRHVATVACTDLRLLYSAGLNQENDLKGEMLIKAAIEYPIGTIIPVSFAGRQEAMLGPVGTLLSSPAPVEIPSGAAFFVRTRTRNPFGAATTLAAAVAAGATTFTLNALPAVTSGLFVVGPLGNAAQEGVMVASVTGTTAPYTATLAPGAVFASAHASGDTVGGQLYTNQTTDTQLSESVVANNAVDLSYSGTFPASNQTTRTLAAATSVGDSVFTLSNWIYGTRLVVGVSTANVETVDVRTVTYDGTTYRAYLASTLTKAHASGDQVQYDPAYTQTALAFSPAAIVADRTVTPAPKTVVVVGDSIAKGYNSTRRAQSSYVETACTAAGRPYVNLAIGGESGATFSVMANSWRRRRAFDLGDWLVFAYGANDVGNGLATMQTQFASIWASAKLRGMKVAVATITPRTTSTDVFASTGNQTPFNATQNTTRINYNDWVRSKPTNVDVVVDLADAVETARNSGIWKADANGPYVGDGLHPTSLGHDLMAATLQAALTSMT